MSALPHLLPAEQPQEWRAITACGHYAGAVPPPGRMAPWFWPPTRSACVMAHEDTAAHLESLGVVAFDGRLYRVTRPDMPRCPHFVRFDETDGPMPEPSEHVDTDPTLGWPT